MWAFGLTLPPFILPWAGYYLGRSSCPSSPSDFYLCFSFSCHAYRPVGCHSCHVGPLGLLPLSLGFPSPFTLPLSLINPMSLLAAIPAMLTHCVYYLCFPSPFTLLIPLINPMGLLAAILTMLAHWVYYLYRWASLAHLLYLDLLLVSFSLIFLIVGLLLPLSLL